MWWKPCLIPFSLCESDETSDALVHVMAPDDAATTASALAELEWGTLLRVDGLRDETLNTAIALLEGVRDASIGCWFDAAPADFISLLARCQRRQYRIAGVTLRLRSEDDLNQAQSLGCALFDAGSIVELRLAASNRLPEGACALIHEDCAAWRTVRDGEPDDYFPKPALAVLPDGHAVGQVGERPLRTSAPVRLLGLDATLRELRLERRHLVGDTQYYPQPVQFARSGGRVRRVYSCSGTQALGHSLAQAEGQAALGFDDEDEFRNWVEEIAGDPNFATTFPAFPGTAETAGVFVKAEQGAVQILRPRIDARPVLVLASWLARGDRENARSALGLQNGVFDAAQKDDLAVLAESDLRRYVDRAASSLSRAVVVMVKARLDREQRERALSALTLLGSPRARDAVRYVAHLDPTIAGPALKRIGNRATRSRVDRAKNPNTALRYLDETIDRICAAATWSGGAR